MHGARGGHKPGKDHPCYRHGLRGADWLELRKNLSALNRNSRRTIQTIQSEDLKNNPENL